MSLIYALRGGLLGLVLWSAPRAGMAQAAAVPAAATSAPSSPWLLKGGLRLTHLSYSRTATSWRLLMPLSLAAERRVGSRLSWYAQFDADMQLASTSLRRRRAVVGSNTTLPAVALGLGARCYYGRPAGATRQQPGVPELGKYLALEASATLSQAGTSATSTTRGAVGNHNTLLVPALYALWGVQNRLRPHLLYDLSAGLGVLAPTRTNAEYYLPRHGWDVGAQVNIRFYLTR
ncbi:hypothetical protein HHL22_12815 [Hymenobacter sp. RP-2-7]|uniref:DUF3575 domain-containing protein n=1 Tax=Hymenobacter polaris TaxID=2682546 RepID=A0A7Y0FMP2_9BACT|nr:hypothetical protein [Hymenobacter polaris]NML66088.1 hypothetical protein [Hymenobacter polaris]